MLTLRLALRNLFRNTRRTVLTCLLIAVSLASLIVVDGVLLGTSRALVDSITEVLSGDVQVHRRGFLDTFDVDLYIDDPRPLEAMLASHPAVQHHALRTISAGMASSPRNVAAVAIYGVDAEREKDLSRLHAAIVEGAPLAGAATEMVLGRDLAATLEARPGDRIVLTTSMVHGGGVTQELFRLAGIADFGVPQLDANVVFINLSRAQELLGLDQGVHEVAVRYRDGEESGDRTHPLLAAVSSDQYEALNWRDFNPEIGSMLEVVGFASTALGVILFLLASFGVVNTMFMSIYERIYEFGVTLSIGTRPHRLILLVLTEAFLIAAISVVWGVLLGGAISWYLSVSGFTLGEMVELPEVTLDRELYTVLEASQFLLFPVFVIILTLVAAAYPAWYASRIVPSEALRARR